ncbi:MAG: hypothetical protein ACE5HE_08460 [Phycisphaerae bacterium]
MSLREHAVLIRAPSVSDFGAPLHDRSRNMLASDGLTVRIRARSASDGLDVETLRLRAVATARAMWKPRAGAWGSDVCRVFAQDDMESLVEWL